MYKKTKKLEYAKKNNIHIFTKESLFTLNNGKYFILTVQRKYNQLNNTTKDYFFKERKVLNLKKTIMGKNTNLENWKISMLNNNSQVREYTEDYKRFIRYFCDIPQPRNNISSINKIVNNFSLLKLAECFNLDGLDYFFNLDGNKTRRNETRRNEILESYSCERYNSCFNHNFYI